MIMTHTYEITGMTCNGCVAKAKSELLKLGDVTGAEVQLQAPQATITMSKHISDTVLQEALSKAGKYTIKPINVTMPAEAAEETKTWLATYKPLLIVFAFILGVSLLTSAHSDGIHWMHFMRNFMAGFFIVFSFFKMLDIKAFAESYASYDLLAMRVPSYGYIYPFIELGLGIAFLLNINPFATNITTIAVMGFSSIGVIKSVMNKRQIRCACLGAVFNLPMSTVTIVEDLLMVAMAAVMIGIM